MKYLLISIAVFTVSAANAQQYPDRLNKTPDEFRGQAESRAALLLAKLKRVEERITFLENLWSDRSERHILIEEIPRRKSPLRSLDTLTLEELYELRDELRAQLDKLTLQRDRIRNEREEPIKPYEKIWDSPHNPRFDHQEPKPDRSDLWGKGKQAHKGG